MQCFTHIVMVLASEVDGVDVHSTVVSPVVGQGNNELDAGVGGAIHHPVKLSHVDSRHAVVPPLKDRLSRTSALAAILRKSVGVEGDVLIVEAPCAEDAKACIVGCT